MRIFKLSFLLITLVTVQANADEPTSSFQVAKPTTEAFRKTLADLRRLREAGQREAATIKLPAGEYHFTETLRIDPALVGEGLKLVAEENGKVVFTGAMSLERVRQDQEGKVFYRLPDDWNRQNRPRVVLVDGELSMPARYPNEDYFRIEQALPDRRSGFTVRENDLPERGLPDHGYDLILLHDWSSSRMPVASFDGESRVLKTVGPIGCSADHYAIDHFEEHPRYYLEGHASFADQVGEWYLDEERNELVLLTKEESEPPVVQLPRLTTILHASGNDDEPLRNLVLEGITFTGTSFPMPPGGLAGAQATMHEPRNAEGERTTSNRPMLPAGVVIERAENVRVNACRFQAMGATGLWLGSRVNQCRLFRCQVEDVGGNGINLGEDNSRRVDGQTWYRAAPDQIPTGNEITDCEISDCGVILPGAVGIWVPLSRELSVVKNHIHDCPYTGISLGWIWNQEKSPAGKNRIAENKIEYVMQVLSDGGGIYTLGRQPESLLEKNVITDVPLNAGRAESNGMFLDQGSTGFTIRGNTFRRIDRSPLRFHQAGENLAEENAWELAEASTPPVRYNNTPEENITVRNNRVLEPLQRIYLIGNSLTWDTIPSRLDEAPEWHVDCGKSLAYLREHPEEPCVGTSRIWPRALRTAQYDFLSFQPHYGTTLEEDSAAISSWIERQPDAIVVIHTGWARAASLLEEKGDEDPAGPLTHSNAYYDALLKRLREAWPEREFRCTRCMNLLWQVQADIESGKAPLNEITDLYRDSIHMTTSAGRYLMHNAMRKTLGQPRTEEGFPEFDKELKSYLDGLLDAHEVQ